MNSQLREFLFAVILAMAAAGRWKGSKAEGDCGKPDEQDPPVAGGRDQLTPPHLRP